MLCVTLCGDKGGHGVTVGSTNSALTSVMQLEYLKGGEKSLLQAAQAASSFFLLSLPFPTLSLVLRLMSVDRVTATF